MSKYTEPPVDAYLVWQLDDGQWAARSKANWPLPATARSIGATPTKAIQTWKRRREEAIRLRQEDPFLSLVTDADNKPYPVRVHFKLTNGVDRTLCGRLGATAQTSTDGADVTCGACQRIVRRRYPGVRFPNTPWTFGLGGFVRSSPSWKNYEKKMRTAFRKAFELARKAHAQTTRSKST